MAGMLFVVCIPMEDHEYHLVHGKPPPPRGPPVTPRGPAVARVDPIQTRCRKIDPDALPMEKVMERLLKRLDIEHAVWCADKNSKFYQVFFSVEAGDATENCLHSLTELKIGKKHNSIVSVIPCDVYMQGLGDSEDGNVDPAVEKAWDTFVDSVRAKLTVKQVVDGVRAGAMVSFDYVLLILTADMVSAVGLLENSEINITAAMLISPLMGTVVAVTFGTTLADRSLQWVGLQGLLAGCGISLVFGFIFGLLVGSTENPWGYGDWPTHEMLTRGELRSLWMGVLWALPSGSGVALALLQGMVGPLIGVAISATVLPPLVNCGLLWGLTCTKLIYGDKMKIPHVAGEPFDLPSTNYKPIYSEYLPYELVTLGIVSFCLTLVNIGCIFITALIVLKIKEVAAPYTSSPDVRAFWEEYVPMTRNFNRMSTRRAKENKNRFSERVPLSTIPQEEMETIEEALNEAMDDDVFRAVRRRSNAHNSSDLPSFLGGVQRPSRPGSVVAGRRSRGSAADPVQELELLDQLIASLLSSQSVPLEAEPSSTQVAAGLRRFRSIRASRRGNSIRGARDVGAGSRGARTDRRPTLPSIQESDGVVLREKPRPMSLTERALQTPGVRAMVRTMQAVPHMMGVGSGASGSAGVPLIENPSNTERTDSTDSV